jgi:hypothetical protein
MTLFYYFRNAHGRHIVFTVGRKLLCLPRRGVRKTKLIKNPRVARKDIQTYNSILRTVKVGSFSLLLAEVTR